MLKTLLTAAALAGCATAALADGHSKPLPPYVTQPNAEMVTFEHIDALNACDWDRLMAEYPEEVLIILPNGVWVEGRPAVGDTVNVSWRVEADWLSEPYKGADAYVTRDGLMYVQVTTFDPAGMKFAE